MNRHGLPGFPGRGGGNVAIVGLGVMGGSIAKALLSRAPGVRVYGVEPDGESAQRAARDGVRLVRRLDECDVDDGVVVFAAPLDATTALIGDTRATWSGAALATDVASLKGPVLEAAGAGAGGEVFVGAHPMCGSERSGYAAARADLFEGADVWVCPQRDASGAAASADSERAGRRERDPAGALGRALTFWRALGGLPRTVAASRHDRIMAWASHLPQLVASALAASLGEAGIAREDLGPGARDMTRLAASDPGMWIPLLEAASAEDARALLTLERHIARIRGLLEGHDLAGVQDMMKRGGQWTDPTR